MVQWHWKKFGELSAVELYEILSLRSRVFVVEQNCVYQDTDGKDQSAYHLWGVKDGQVVAYLRALPPGAKYPETALGRIVTAPEGRALGLGKALMAEGIQRAEAVFGIGGIRISAQSYLERFYGGFGFRKVGEEYLEDGIPHREMLRP